MLRMTSTGYTEAGEVLRTVRVRFMSRGPLGTMSTPRMCTVSLVHSGAYDRRGSAVCDVRFSCRSDLGTMQRHTAHGFSVGMGQVEDSKRAVAHAIELSLAQDDVATFLRGGAVRAALEDWASIHGE